MKSVGQALDAHARDPSAPALHVHVTGYLGAEFLLALAGVFLAGATILPGIGRSAKTEPTAVDAPEPLRGKTLLNVAALLEANDADPAWAAEIDKRVSPEPAAREAGAGEEEHFRASARARRAAAQLWLRHLFPGATAAKVDAAWLRAEALDAATTRWARKEYRYPGTEADVPPDPRLVCPGFTEDVYRYVSNYVMTTLR